MNTRKLRHDRNQDPRRQDTEHVRQFIELIQHELSVIEIKCLDLTGESADEPTVVSCPCEAVVPAWCGEDLTSLQFGLQIHARLTGKEREQVMVIDDDHAVAVYSSARSGSAAMTRSTASAYVPSRSNPPITTPTAGGIRSSTGEPSPGESSPTSAARRLARSTVASRS